MSRRKGNQKTKHHVIPTSREHKPVIGVCMVEDKIHNLSHQLFGNMTPEEIVEWLNHTLWGDRYQISITRVRPLF